MYWLSGNNIFQPTDVYSLLQQSVIELYGATAADKLNSPPAAQQVASRPRRKPMASPGSDAATASETRDKMDVVAESGDGEPSATKESASSSPAPPSTPTAAADNTGNEGKNGTPAAATTPAAAEKTSNSKSSSGPPSAVEFEPPVACVRRILKKTLPSSSNVGKDAVAAFARASGIFIIYLTACANDFARENRRQTITANDVLAAIKVCSKAREPMNVLACDALR